MSPNNSINCNDDDEIMIIDSNTPLIINKSENNKEIKEEELLKKIPLSQHKYWGQLVILFTFFAFFIMGTFLYSVYLPNVYLVHAQKTYPNYSQHDIQSKASYYKSYADSLPYIALFLFGPLTGYLSDRFGRKPVLLFCLFLALLDVVFCFIAIKTNQFIYFYIVHTIAGINNVVVSICFNFISDISEEQHVSILYSILSFFMGLGVVIGPLFMVVVPAKLISGFLILYISLGIIGFSFILIFFLKESLLIAKQSNRIKDHSKTINPFKTIKNLFSTSGYISWIILIYISISFSSQDVWSTYYYYCNLLYNFNEVQNAEFVVYLGALVMVFGLIFPILLKYFSERKLISFSFSISVISHVLLVLSFQFRSSGKWIYLLATGIGANNPNTNNLLSSLIAKESPAELQGSILAGVNSITSIASFIGALASNDIYMFSISSSSKIYYPPLIYLINTVILFLTFIGTLLVWKFYKSSSSSNNNKQIK